MYVLAQSNDDLYRTFPGWLGREPDVDHAMHNSLVILDANVLLACYRIVPQARDDLLTILGNLGARLWVPHQAALEFVRNREAVIPDRNKRFKEVSDLLANNVTKAANVLQAAVEGIQKYRQAVAASRDWAPENYDLGNDQLRARIRAITSAGRQELDLLKAEGQSGPITLDEDQDSVLVRVNTVVKGRIGPRYDAATLRRLIEEADSFRFPNRIPPGYLDARDKPPARAAGDYILWRQVIDRVKSQSKRDKYVVLVTTDVKQDWWREGRTSEARPELVQELYDETGSTLVLLTLVRFLENARRSLDADVSNALLNAARGLETSEEPPQVFDGSGATTLDRFVQEVELANLARSLFESMGYLVVDIGAKRPGFDLLLTKNNETTVVAVRAFAGARSLFSVIDHLAEARDAVNADYAVLVHRGRLTTHVRLRAKSRNVEILDEQSLGVLTSTYLDEEGGREGASETP